MHFTCKCAGIYKCIYATYNTCILNLQHLQHLYLVLAALAFLLTSILTCVTTYKRHQTFQWCFLAPFSRPFPKLDFWMHFGHPLAHFGLPFGSLWLPFGSLWLPFGSPWLPFGTLWLTFGTLWSPFGPLWIPFDSLLVPLGVQVCLQSRTCDFQKNVGIPYVFHVFSKVGVYKSRSESYFC